jgi:L-iditol 2-dehydrogenase
MWAYAVASPYRFEQVEVPEPKAADLRSGEAIVQMRAGAICGSDLYGFRGGVVYRGPDYTANGADEGSHAARLPGFPLHEIVGDVIASNSELRVGQRVAGWATASEALRDRIVVDMRSVHPISAGLTPVQQTVLQPLACALHAVSRLGQVGGMRAAVIGLGPHGLLFSHILRSSGADQLTGVDRIDRSDVAAAFGIDVVVPTGSDRWARALPKSERPDIIIEAVGHQTATLNHAIHAVADGGRVYYFGVADEPMYPVDIFSLQRRNLTLLAGGTPVAARRGALERAIKYLGDHPDLPKSYITNVFSVSHVQQAFLCADTPVRGRLKVALEWD